MHCPAGSLHLEAIAQQRAQALLQDHRRVREAADANGSYQVTASLPVDVMGVYVLVPAGVSAVKGPNAWPAAPHHQLAYQAIRIEGGLIPADELTRLTTLQAPDKTEQTEAHYRIPKGLKLRDEIAALPDRTEPVARLPALRQRQDVNAHDVHGARVPAAAAARRAAASPTSRAAPAIVAASGHAVHHRPCCPRWPRAPRRSPAHNQGLGRRRRPLRRNSTPTRQDAPAAVALHAGAGGAERLGCTRSGPSSATA